MNTSLVAQTVKRLSTMRETWFQSLGREDSLEKGMATHFHVLAWKISWTKEPGVLYSPWRCKESDTTKRLSLTHSQNKVISSQVALVVKNPPTMQETQKTWVQYLGLEVSLE